MRLTCRGRLYRNCTITAARVGLACVGVMLIASSGEARRDPPVQESLPGCHAAIADDATVADRIDGAGRCSGVVETLIYLGSMLPDHLRSCVPSSVLYHEAVRRVTDHLEQNYGSTERQSFKSAAIDVLRKLWPCANSER